MSTSENTYEIRKELLPELTTAVAETTAAVSEIGDWLGQAFGAVAQACAESHCPMAGPPFARYRMLGEGRFAIQAGFPTLGAVASAEGVHASTLPGGPAAVTTHLGRFDEMVPGYRALEKWLSDHGYAAAGDPWEVYLTDPDASPDPATWRTDIVQPYRDA